MVYFTTQMALISYFAFILLGCDSDKSDYH